MTSANRVTGACAVALGLLLWFVVLPAQTEGVDGGHMPPDFLPRICAGLMVGAGLWQLIRPFGETDFDFHRALSVLIYLAIVAVGVYGIGWFGFVAVAPVLAAALMLRAGERRWSWLVVGVLLIPLGTWYGVVRLLGRVIA